MSVRAPRPNPSFDAVSAPQDFYRLFTGDGWTAGFDLTGVYKTQRVESTLSYTLSKISQRFDGLFKGESFSPTEDRRHQFKFSSLYKIGNVSLSGLFNYKTKAPYVSFNLIDRDGGLGGADRASVIKYLPPYFSLDLAIDYTFKIGNETGMIGVSVINATDHENVNELQHIGRLPAGIQMSDIFLTHQTELLGRTFNVHFAILVH